MTNVNKDENSEKTLSAGKQNKVLRALVQQHKICWEVLPEQIPVNYPAFPGGVIYLLLFHCYFCKDGFPPETCGNDRVNSRLKMSGLPGGKRFDFASSSFHFPTDS